MVWRFLLFGFPGLAAFWKGMLLPLCVLVECISGPEVVSTATALEQLPTLCLVSAAHVS